jgi:hypothetical protein
MKDSKLITVTSLVLLAVLAVTPARGHDTGPEFIESFDTTLDIEEGGGLSIRHVIDVHPHGDEIRRGLFFELPEDVGPLSDFAASLDGEPVAPEFDDGAVIVASAEPLATHRTHRFTLRYRAGSPWWLESSGTARLQWEPIVAQFELAWRDASLRIALPDNAARPELPEAGTVDGNAWTRTLRGPLYGDSADAPAGPVELRVAASTLQPQALRQWGSDWPWRALLLAGLLGLLGFLHGAWRAVGRDPDPGTISLRQTPPDGLSPAAARFVDRMGFDETAFVAALVSLRVKQVIALSIDEDEETLRLERRRYSSSSLSPGERALLDALFDGGDAVELGAGDERASRAAEALKKKLGEEHRGRHFVVNAFHRNWGIALGLMLTAVSIVALIVQARDALTPDPWIVGLGFTGLLVGVVAPLIYFELFKAPTRAGTTVKGQIAGLKRYFEEADTPVTGAAHFVKLLPYAVALDCEPAWLDRFEGDDESGVDRETAEVVAWYREFQRRHETAGAINPIIAGATAASAATASAGGGASAGGV